MKRSLFALLCFALTAVTGTVSAEENPYVKGPAPSGEVSLPLQDWQTVWKAASQPPVKKTPLQKAPVPSALLSASYAGKLEAQSLHCEATFRVRSFSEDWQTLPLAGAEWTLDTNFAAPAGVAIVRSEGKLCALLHGVGDFELKLPLSLTLLDNSAKVTLAQASAQSFTLAPIDEKYLLTVNTLPPVVNATKDLAYTLPPQGGEVVLALETNRPAARSELPEPPKALEPSTWIADTQALALFQDGSFHYTARAYLRAAKGSGVEATLKLPANSQVEDVTSDDLASWKTLRSADGSQRLLQIKWKTMDRLDRKVQLRYEIPQSPVATEWTLIAPQGDEAGGKGAFALAPLEGIEFSHPALQRMPSGQVVAWIRELAAVPELLLIEGDMSLKLSAKALPRMETAKATIKTLAVRTRLVADGSLLHELTYEFEHRGLYTWRITIPQGATLLDCKMNNADARPIQRAPQELEFPLLSKTDGLATTKISLTYHAKAAVWDRVSGSVALELPKTEVFTQAMHWQVELPDGYDLTASSDSLAITDAKDPAAPDRTVAFKKELFANEAPGVELFYQRRAVE